MATKDKDTKEPKTVKIKGKVLEETDLVSEGTIVNIMKTTNVALQAAALKFSFGIGFGVGASVKVCREIFNKTPTTAFMKEIGKQIKSGYDEGLTHEDISEEVAGDPA